MKRAQQKESRRASILDGAEALVRETRGTDFSMHDLAAKAGLSTATTYNLIGTKATVLYALLNRSVDRLSAERASIAERMAPVDYVDRAGRIAVDFFARDPGFYRPLMRFLLGVPEPVHRPRFMARAHDFWHAVVDRLGTEGRLERGIEASDVARALHLLFTGALDLWVHDELDAAQFRAQVRHGSALILLSLSLPRTETCLLEKLREARPRIRRLYNPSFPAPVGTRARRGRA